MFLIITNKRCANQRLKSQLHTTRVGSVASKSRRTVIMKNGIHQKGGSALLPLDVSSLKRPLSKESLTKIDPVHQKPHDRHPGAPRQFFLVHARPARHDGAQAVEVTVGVTFCLNSTALFCQSFGRTVFMKNFKKCQKKRRESY